MTENGPPDGNVTCPQCGGEVPATPFCVRCGYPFGGSIDEMMRVLERLHASIGELMQPLEPTFPNWQGLYAG